MAKIRLFIVGGALWLAWGGSYAQAENSPEAGSGLGEIRLAMAGPVTEAGRLDHLFDAARMRLQAVLAPKPGAFPEGAQTRDTDVHIVIGPQSPSPKAAPAAEAAVTTTPNEAAAYRRTFNILLSHPETTDRYDELILKYAQAYNLEPRLLKAIIAAESEFFFGALSPRGARGLMQVMPRTAEEMGVPARQLSDPEFNIRAGAAYVARLFQSAFQKFRLKGVSFYDAPQWLKQRIIAAYNAGPRFLFHNRWFRQTRHYVRKVMLFYASQVTEFRRPPKTVEDPNKVAVAPSSGILY